MGKILANAIELELGNMDQTVACRSPILSWIAVEFQYVLDDKHVFVQEGEDTDAS